MNHRAQYFWRFFCGLLLSLLGATIVHAGTFSDVPDEHANATAINDLATNGIVIGYEDGTFKPDQTINRAEWLKMLSVGLNLSLKTDASQNFPDVPAEAWFADYVANAASNGIVDGYPDGFFRPEQTVNRVESLKMLLLAGGVTPETPTENPAIDVLAGEWFASSVSTALSKNIIEIGVTATVDPAADMTRGESAEFLYRLLQSRENDGVYNLSERWDTVEFPSVFTSLKVADGWTTVAEATQIVIWSQDTTNHQISYVRTTQDSGVVVIAHDSNSDGLSSTDYFTGVRANVSADATVTESTEWGDVPALLVETPHEDSTTVDLYAYLDDGSVAILYGTYGKGMVGMQRGRKIVAMLKSFRPIPGNPTDSRTSEEILSDARANIAIDGKGTETLGWFTDQTLISTDAIGVGTGPVDYYYSPSFNITLKYERSFDVILDITEGETDAF